MAAGDGGQEERGGRFISFILLLSADRRRRSSCLKLVPEQRSQVEEVVDIDPCVPTSDKGSRRRIDTEGLEFALMQVHRHTDHQSAT